VRDDIKKYLDSNDKLRVIEVTFKPGDTAPSAKRPMRVVHAYTGGTLERTYDDGTKETVQLKTGETRIISEKGLTLSRTSERVLFACSW